MKSFLYLFLLLLHTISFSQTKLLSWNIENLGKSKSDTTINYIANTIQNYDIIAIQEVVAGYGGAQAVARLVDELNRTGSKWDYTIRDPSCSSAYISSRYASLWLTSSLVCSG